MKNTHLNSLLAFRENGREFNAREAEIILFCAANPGKRTDRQLAAAMGYSHRSAVQPRVSTLINDGGILAQVGTTKCRETGKTVRLVALSPEARALLPACWQRHERRGRPRKLQAAAQPCLF